MLLRGDEDTRLRFLGAPAGYEFMSLIEALILAGTDGVTGVPKTVVNGTIEMLGALPESVFVRTAVGAPEPVPGQSPPS